MEKIIKINSKEEAIALYGSLDQNIRKAEEEYGVKILAKNDKLKISGESVNVGQAFSFFMHVIEEFKRVKEPKLKNKSKEVSPHSSKNEHHKDSHNRFFHRGKLIRAQSKNQSAYLKAIQEKDIVVSIGPAGTGKTYLAVAAAVDALKKKLVGRIILTRPAVEAGESLGFLPGDMAAKVNPYLRPLYDALYDMLEYEEVARYLERGVIEIAPLAYMRGRTLNDAFIIFDEAQNCTHSQMKMFLTRFGISSKIIMTGDVTQIDLPSGKQSGLVEVKAILANIMNIQFCYFDESDVVRHPLVRDIIKAYEKHEKKKSRSAC